ncbi:endonuclease/exonuclease/phosphatase family protein [Murinocardiopsis flavida]|uniref:Endonuclease/exonuclease/phosphatase family protein n=1 Tax=Murinocardiopsis flavida TaxID=645275 RepID=A0A2P8D3Q4_9ACTN|nr:endonuclease/exonuclease/phosphatase family protein [Murinocardiopsis flavida]PSK91845.1 endonuclease/exonuclease/phosphatase family protein [Murinocardiopsis flavida]
MHRPRRPLLVLSTAACSLSLLLGAAPAAGADPHRPAPADRGDSDIRFATFNASLNRPAEGDLVDDLSGKGDEQARGVAEVVQRQRPDVLLLNEFDHDADGRAAALFQRNYLDRGQGGAKPIDYPYRYTAPVNTGVASGFDLDNDGTAVTDPGSPGYAEDALGFGAFAGQYGMVVYSKYPIDKRRVRTFQDFRWADMPGALLPEDPETGEPFYSDEEREALPLSSKSHWDIPVRTPRGRTTHFLVAHPTPPSFDGPERRNANRNHDEIRFWADYVRFGKSRYIYDDEGRRGGLKPGARFVVAGDLNADPLDGDGRPEGIRGLLESPRVTDPRPASEGGPEAAERQGGANADHKGDPANDTADFGDDPAPGNLRVDYVLPSRGTRVESGGVFWPTADDPLARLNAVSDHHMVWLDVR